MHRYRNIFTRVDCFVSFVCAVERKTEFKKSVTSKLSQTLMNAFLLIYAYNMDNSSQLCSRKSIYFMMDLIQKVCRIKTDKTHAGNISKIVPSNKGIFRYKNSLPPSPPTNTHTKSDKRKRRKSRNERQQNNPKRGITLFSVTVVVFF